MSTESEKVINIKDWQPVGNLLMLKPSEINKATKFELAAEKNCFEIVGFGSSYAAKGLEEQAVIGDKVLIIEPENKPSKGTKMLMGTEEIWFYPPETVSVVLHKENEEDENYKVIPVADYVLLKREASEKKVGNLFIPASAEEKSTHAKVIAIGSGITSEDKKHEFILNKDDEVLISKWTNNEITVNGETIIIAKECEILAVVKKDEETKN